MAQTKKLQTEVRIIMVEYSKIVVDLLVSWFFPITLNWLEDIASAVVMVLPAN